MVSREALSVLKEVTLTLTLWWHPLKIWVFMTSITNKFILGLHILRAYSASLNSGYQILCLKGVTILPWGKALTLATGQVTRAQCERLVMTRLESPLGV